MSGFVLVAVSALLICGCSEEIDGRVVSAWSPSQVAALPDTIALSGMDVSIRAYAGRDFMPMAPPDGRPLGVSADLIGTPSGPLAFTPSRPILYVILDDRMWMVSAESMRPAENATELWRFYAINGPKWGPGVPVSVVVEFGDEAGNRHRVVARNVNISRSD